MGREPAPSLEQQGYWYRSQQPLQSLLFLLPLILVYEAGLLILRPGQAGHNEDILARRMLLDFFATFGLTGYLLPGLLVVVVLIVMHLLKGDRWRFTPKLYLAMLVESALLALPLLVLGLVVSRQPAQAAAGLPPSTKEALDGLVFSIGAGIYEELVFRLAGIALVHALLVNLLALPEHIGRTGAVLGTALAFSLYHFSFINPSPEQAFALGKAVYLFVGGVYFAVIYVWRGFGIVVATHALYDVYVTGLRVMSDL